MKEVPLLIDARDTLRRNAVLLIGANGFLGKVLLGLLLDRYPEFQQLHILMRPRRKAQPSERFETEVLASPPLQAIVRKPGMAEVLRKVTLHAGDVGQPDCGLSEDTLATLSGQVGLVINCAGLVEFFPPVDDSFVSNVDGVGHAIELTRRLGAKLLHVSTCFVCGEADGLVEESEPILGFYPRRKGAGDQGFRHDREIAYMRERIKVAYEMEGLSRGARRPRELSHRLSDLGLQRAYQWGWTNTYTYTKSLGEQLIAAQDDLAYTIVRPAIVEAALEFPFPGWVEGGRTAAPLVMMAMSGLRHWTVREDAPMEVVPVDLTASAILIAGVMLLNGCAEKVYQVSTADVNPIYYGPLIRILYEEYRRQQRRRTSALGLLSPSLGVRVVTPEAARARGRRPQRALNQLQQWATDLRRLMDRSRIPGSYPLRRVASKLRQTGLRVMVRDQALDLYRPFMHDNRFIFENENIRRAWRRLSEEDRKRLPWNPEQIDWRDYWVNNEVAGVQKWVQTETSFHV
jgi:long-chain acyl-CoA synthetase